MMERIEVFPEWALPIRSTFFLAMVSIDVVVAVASISDSEDVIFVFFLSVRNLQQEELLSSAYQKNSGNKESNTLLAFITIYSL